MNSIFTYVKTQCTMQLPALRTKFALFFVVLTVK